MPADRYSPEWRRDKYTSPVKRRHRAANHLAYSGAAPPRFLSALGIGGFLFFFQAEDGIRDLTVTGVQTCALPISGVPPADRERIWDRFWRLERDRGSAVAGTGIGLSVVRELVALHGGRAWAEERSEERRVGEEGRSRWSPDHLKKKKNRTRTGPSA